MSEITDRAIALIHDQINLVVQLQQQVQRAIDRSDWQLVDRLVGTTDKAFNTFLQGINGMAIDVSALKNLLTSGAVDKEVITQLQATVDQLAADIKDVKDALIALNEAATPEPK